MTQKRPIFAVAPMIDWTDRPILTNKIKYYA